jgi:hypothetical protein
MMADVTSMADVNLRRLTVVCGSFDNDELHFPEQLRLDCFRYPRGLLCRNIISPSISHILMLYARRLIFMCNERGDDRLTYSYAFGVRNLDPDFVGNNSRLWVCVQDVWFRIAECSSSRLVIPRGFA